MWREAAIMKLDLHWVEKEEGGTVWTGETWTVNWNINSVMEDLGVRWEIMCRLLLNTLSPWSLLQTQVGESNTPLSSLCAPLRLGQLWLSAQTYCYFADSVDVVISAKILKPSFPKWSCLSNSHWSLLLCDPQHHGQGLPCFEQVLIP